MFTCIPFVNNQALLFNVNETKKMYKYNFTTNTVKNSQYKREISQNSYNILFLIIREKLVGASLSEAQERKGDM